MHNDSQTGTEQITRQHNRRIGEPAQAHLFVCYTNGLKQPATHRKTSPKKPVRHKSRRKKKASLRQRLFGGISSRALWIGGIISGCIYIYIFYAYVVSPFAMRWHGLYGEINYPEGYSIRGIDVSHHQGTIDWEKLSHAKMGNEPISFVFIKATEGKSLLDENFNDNFYQAREYGFTRGAYHYFHPEMTAKEQARFFLRQVHLEEGDLPPVLDIETTGKLTPAQLRKEALTWLRIVERQYGVKPILYTYYKFKTGYLNTPEFDEYPYWIAHYYVNELGFKGKWKFWQHTDRGRLEGIRGYVDLNIYNGSMYDLRQLTLK